MTNNNRKPLIALVALSAALAMPLAFAQEKTDDAAQAQQTEQSSEQAAGSATTPTQSTEAGATQAKQGWADVDTNGDGNISKEEAGANPGLSQVFDQADANTDGSLTADEYKAFVSKNYGDQQK
ncbi:EF-hand domain-containing protein [uncultured Pseudoxanthomonas sp.]|uniref:EF-hand domain-containing protein n=1 Tax=uncultured Pseudoxanthomonas sp. TaxID=281701 RepID=UPI00261D2147|nr:EF-hand domain-containing protein [uncultured Pseudoxanthomonas sp.]